MIRLEKVRDASELPKVIRIAAIASLLVVEKYSKLSELSEVYRIAMGTCLMFAKYSCSLSLATVMCPDKKLTWFNDNDATAAEELVRQRWSETYERNSDAEVPSHSGSSPVKVCCVHFGCSRGSKPNPGTFKVALERVTPDSAIARICLRLDQCLPDGTASVSARDRQRRWGSPVLGEASSYPSASRSYGVGLSISSWWVMSHDLPIPGIGLLHR